MYWLLLSVLYNSEKGVIQLDKYYNDILYKAIIDYLNNKYYNKIFFALLCFAWELRQKYAELSWKNCQNAKSCNGPKQEIFISFFWYWFLSYSINDANLCAGHICRETQDFSGSSPPLLVTITVSLSLSLPPPPLSLEIMCWLRQFAAQVTELRAAQKSHGLGVGGGLRRLKKTMIKRMWSAVALRSRCPIEINHRDGMKGMCECVWRDWKGN